MKHAIALVIAATAIACGAFVGPATKQPACPVLCGHYEGLAVCCSYGEECTPTGWPDRPCRPALGASRDAGAE